MMELSRGTPEVGQLAWRITKNREPTTPSSVSNGGLSMELAWCRCCSTPVVYPRVGGGSVLCICD